MSAQDDEFIAEALPAFVSEAYEQMETFEQLLLRLEDAPQDRELLDALFRCAHTVKGSAGMFGLDEVVAFTHHVETLLELLREGVITLDSELGTLLLQANDQARALVRRAEEAGTESEAAAANRELLVARMRQACGQAQPAAPASEAAPVAAAPTGEGGGWSVQVRFGADTFRNGLDPVALLNYVRKIGTVSAVACDLAGVPALDALDAESCHLGLAFHVRTEAGREGIEQAFSFAREDCELTLTPDAAPAPAQPQAAVVAAEAVPSQPSPKGTAAAEAAVVAPLEEARFIRVQADRLDAVINLLGELVIAGAGASLLARRAGQGALIEAHQQITRLTEEIRNSTLQLRMVPIGETFARLRRVVRDAASGLGKDVALDIVGAETELDKAVVERIADPLMHVVRNALDHGLETPEDRLAAGKPAQGRLRLEACHESGSVLIRIIDDGRGIQRQKVLERAWERGLVEPGTSPPEAEVLSLIFEPGFSTAEKVTNLSGRGVGMDVVRRNVEALRGAVTIASEPGRGTTLQIRLPLTLAIIDGFLVGVGPSKFVFPLDSVAEVIENRAVVAVHDARGRGTLELRGRQLPVLSLRRLYGLDSPEPAQSSVVVVQAGERRFGVMVDSLLGQHQTVIKPLGRMFRNLRGMNGSSILGSGEIALIFDVNSLGELAAADLRWQSAAARNRTPFPSLQAG